MNSDLNLPNGSSKVNKAMEKAHVDLSESSTLFEQSCERPKRTGCKKKSRDSSTKSWADNNRKLIPEKYQFKVSNKDYQIESENESNDALSMLNKQINVSTNLKSDKSYESNFENANSIKYKSLLKNVEDSFYVSKDYRQFCLNNKLKTNDYLSPNSSNCDGIIIRTSKCISNTESHLSSVFEKDSVIKAVCNLNDSSPLKKRSFIKNKENQVSRNTKTCDTSYTDLQRYKQHHNKDFKYSDRMRKSGSKKIICKE